MDECPPVRRARARAALIAAMLAATSGSAGAQIFGPQPVMSPSRYVVGRLGVVVNEATARHDIAFRPFTPPRHILAVALLPPFHGADVRANRGIAFEYTDIAGHRYALAQWPANRGNVERFAPLTLGEAQCPGARSFARGTGPSGIVWTTPHGLIISLQADGDNDARTLRTEWRNLIRRGVCR